jgi:hypothetical protein
MTGRPHHTVLLTHRTENVRPRAAGRAGLAGPFFGNAIADWTGAVLTILATKCS